MPRLQDVILETFGLAEAAGAFRVVADQDVVVSSRIYNLKGSVTFGQGFEGVPRARAVQAGRSTDVVGLSETSSFRTNIILMDASDAAEGSTVQLSLRAPDGSEIASGTYQLGRLEPRLFQARDLGVSTFESAILHARVTSGAALVMASKVDNDPATGDPTTLESWTSAGDPAADQDLLALVAGTLIDGNGGAPVPDAAVVIQGSHIAFAGPATAITIPTRATVIDVSGHTILPGFFNTHVHEASFTVRDPLLAVDVSRLAAWAWEGVTTVRDVTSPMIVLRRYKQATWAHDDPQLARLLMAGPCFEVPGGRADTFNRLIITSEQDARVKTEYLLDAGADLVKLYFEDGSIFGEQWNVMTTDEARAIVGVAHGRGKLATVHVQEAYLVERALDAGVDDICHSQVDGPVPDQLIERMVAQRVYLVPTLEAYATSAQGLATACDNLARMASAGVGIAVGTDYSATFPVEFELGMPLHELNLMRQAGMTPMQVIVAGTRNSAHVCGLENDLGTLERGKIADLIVVDGDPLEDLSVLKDNLRMVVHYGVIIRDELD